MKRRRARGRRTRPALPLRRGAETIESWLDEDSQRQSESEASQAGADGQLHCSVCWQRSRIYVLPSLQR